MLFLPPEGCLLNDIVRRSGSTLDCCANSRAKVNLDRGQDGETRQANRDLPFHDSPFTRGLTDWAGGSRTLAEEQVRCLAAKVQAIHKLESDRSRLGNTSGGPATHRLVPRWRAM